MGRPKAKVRKIPPPTAITIRATPEWLAWLDGLRAKHGNMPRTTLIDQALAEKAKASDHPPPPARF